MTRMKIDYDQYAESPREWDNLGTMLCKHRRYNLGDEGAEGIGWYDLSDKDVLAVFGELPSSTQREVEGYMEDGESKAEVCREMLSDWEIDPMDYGYAIDGYLMMPLYLYDHGGITMNTTGFSCGWDSGQVGVIYVSHDKIAEEYGDTSPESIAKAKKCLKSEVEVYDLYIRGNVFGFIIEGDEADEDSCWGFLIDYGDKQLGGMIDHLPKEMHEAAHEAFDNIGEWVEIEETTLTKG